MTPLHWTVDMGMVGDSDERAEIVRFLLASGADINATDKGGRSVLAVAVLAGSAKLIQLLVDAEADVNLADEGGCTPLDVATSNHSRTNIYTLKNAGARRGKG